MVWLHVPALLVLGCLALLPAQPAVAQVREPSPSARQIREAYPLHSRPQAGTDARAGPTDEPAPAATAETPGRSRAEESSPARFRLVDGVLVILAFAAGAALALRVPTRRSRGRSQSSADPVAVAPTIAGRTPQTAAASPQATRRGWTAEIEWHPAGAEACFRVIARPAQGTATAVVAESARLEWPPSTAAAVAAVTAAADELETRLVSAGWRPVPGGDAWYAKRFTWEPAEAAGRFDRRAAWPQETEKLWRGEGSPPDRVAPNSTQPSRAT